MKNYLSIFVFILFFIYSCDKQNQMDEIINTTATERSFLTFDDTDKFDAAISDHSTTLASINNAPTFKSFITKFKELEKQEILELEGLSDFASNDNFIHLLDEHQMVQIGAWICQLDFKTKEVYVLHERHWEKVKLNDLKSVAATYTFSFEEEVSAYIDVAASEKLELDDAKQVYIEASNGANSAARGVCPSVTGKNKEKAHCNDLEYTSDIDQKKYSAKVKLVYQKVGIYFAVKAQVKNYRTWAGCNFNTGGSQSISYGQVIINRKKWRYRGLKRVCEDYYTGNQFSYTTQGEGNANDVDNSAAVLRNKLYEGIRGLQELNVTAQFDFTSHHGHYIVQRYTFNIQG